MVTCMLFTAVTPAAAPPAIGASLFPPLTNISRQLRGNFLVRDGCRNGLQNCTGRSRKDSLKTSGIWRIWSSIVDEAPIQNSDLVVGVKSVSVILLAGGRGKRMGADIPKQYLPLLGKPIALHSFCTFASMPEVSEIVVVCDPSYRDTFEALNVNVIVKFALPGKERQDSVHSGLQEIDKSSKLACVHDSARPLVLPKDVRKVLKDALIYGAAVLGVPVKATIKEADGNLLVTKTLDRKTLWEIQTPQVIEPRLFHKGFELVQREGLEVTDDVSIVEYLKHPVLITEGSYTNLKVTTPDDMLVAERILQQSGTPVGVAVC